MHRTPRTSFACAIAGGEASTDCALARKRSSSLGEIFELNLWLVCQSIARFEIVLRCLHMSQSVVGDRQKVEVLRVANSGPEIEALVQVLQCVGVLPRTAECNAERIEIIRGALGAIATAILASPAVFAARNPRV